MSDVSSQVNRGGDHRSSAASDPTRSSWGVSGCFASRLTAVVARARPQPASRCCSAWGRPMVLPLKGPIEFVDCWPSLEKQTLSMEARRELRCVVP